MRRFYTLLFVFWGLVGLENQARADACNTGANTGNIVANCAFQTGNFTGWIISGNTANPAGNYYGVDMFDAYPGPPASTYGAYMSQDQIAGGETPVDLSQILATSVGTTYDIAFYLMQDNAPSTGYTHSFDATWGGTTLVDLTPTVALPGPVGVWTEYTFSETASAASTTLNFAFVNDDNYWSFDDVSVVPVPEPSSWPPLLTAVALSAFVVRRRSLALKRLRATVVTPTATGAPHARQPG
jgi:hypothetical protein